MFDYIIVGGGSAGCVLAARLSEQPDATVLLLEAGGRDAKQEIHVPAGWPKLLKSEVDWAFTTASQPELGTRSLYWPRGKVLGGSSSINALIFTRGNRRDFGDFDRVETLFQRVEEAIGPSDAAPGHQLSRAFVEGCIAAGIPRNSGGFNGDEQEGAGFFHVSVRNGKRSSAAAAYLKPAASRPNLTVRTGTSALRIVVDAGRAGAVVCGGGGVTETIRARREIIVASGAIKSPHLLLLSGIGSADDLRGHGIAVVRDLPGVGRNLQDHLMGGVVHECTQPVTMDDAGTVKDIVQYLLTRRGRLRSNLAEAGAFVKVDSSATRPDIELIFAPVFYMNHGFDNPKGYGFSIGAVLQHPHSTGSISLQSASPADAPRIAPNYLADARDLATLVAGVKLARRVAQGRPFDAYRGRELWPGPDATSDEAIAAQVRATAETLYHPIGTCRMGTDPMAVVGPDFRVHGVDGLRVVDASVLPDHITGHPNAVVMMLAERAAEAIKNPAMRNLEFGIWNA
ncbi:MAG TPA: GMC oxidoreductase [Rhodanobacteraceae bacterium]